MKLFTFSVYYIGATEEVVTAGCPTDAVILASANRINKGFHRQAFQVHNRDTGEMWGLKGTEPVSVNYIP